MRAGELRHRVTIQQYAPDRDDYGAEVEVWIDIATVWAAIEPVSGAEQYQAQADQLVARRLTQIRIRERDGLDNAKLRIVRNNRTFDVQSVQTDPTLKRQMILTCQELNV